MTRRRLLAPEVIQASAMDCGPAALKCLLEGHGTPVSYGRLREACQTDVDGASIDTLEDMAGRLGLDAEQVMLPPDHLLLAESRALPALVVMRMPGGDPHVVVLWRTHGPVVQVMDPATGRRWTTAARFLDDCYIHTTEVPAAVWREWAASSAALAVLRRRSRSLRVSPSSADALAGRALEDPGWRALGALDAAVRMTTSLVAARGIARGQEAESILRRLFDAAVAAPSPKRIPDEYWTVSAAPPADGREQVRLRGAVLVTVRGARPVVDAGLSPELRAALEEHPTRPGRELLTLLAADGVFAPLSMGLALALAAGGVLLEAVLFRGFFDLGRELGLSGQRLGALALGFMLLGVLLVLEFPLAALALRMGRHLECRLRLAFLRKIPRLGDRYFQSRLRSDMTERSHSIYRIRRLPDLGGQWLRFVFELVLTAVGIAWLDPGAAPIAALSAGVALLVPLAVQPLFNERDLRVRTHVGALGRYYLDALLGLRAIRCHGAERPIRREHEGLLVEWARAGFRLQRLAAGVEAVQLSLGVGLSVWLLFDHLSRNHEVGGVMLLIYWALNLPMLGQEIGQLAWQYPGLRNATLRLLEPLGALEEEQLGARDMPPVRASGIAVQMQGVGVRAAGHAILGDISVDIPAGAHVAIVGASGAGKSTLVGLLLGWHRAATGCVLVDGQRIEAVGREALCRDIAWVDPAVHLWNRSLLDNLCYGSHDASVPSVGTAIDAANLVTVLRTLPDGLQTPLGEGGSRVSGGEGQRVRLARALLRRDVRLAILDEPFRGLERDERRDLLVRARRLWNDATLFCITHDIGETLAFDRVLVVEGGRIVEDGSPVNLAERSDTRYRQMLDEEAAVRRGLWNAATDETDAAAGAGAAERSWRRLRLVDGVLVEHTATPVP